MELVIDEGTACDNKYYFDDKGVMVFGKWLQIDGKWHYFYANGKLAVSMTTDTSLARTVQGSKGNEITV